MYQTIRYEKQDGIAIVTINRPEALNALNSTVISELEQVIGEVEKDQELGAMILTGEGRSFVAGADIGEQYGLRYTNSAFSGLMIAVIPIVTLIMAAAFLKDRPSRAQWLFSLLSIAGIALISVVENSGGQVQFIGVIFLIAAVISGSAYGVISRSISDEFSVYERTYFMQLMGGVFYTVLAFAEHRGDLGAIIAPLANADFVAAVLYLALGASVLGYSLFNYAVSNAPMANVISLCNLTTVISVAAGIVLLGEPFSPVSLIAMLAVLVGIWGVQKFPPKEQS